MEKVDDSADKLFQLLDQTAHTWACDAVLMRRSAAALRGDRMERFACPAREKLLDHADAGLMDAIEDCEEWCSDANYCRHAGLSLRDRIEGFLTARKKVQRMLRQF